jgi:hypothetical protein
MLFFIFLLYAPCAMPYADVLMTPDTRLRGRSRFVAAKSRHLKPIVLKHQKQLCIL